MGLRPGHGDCTTLLVYECNMDLKVCYSLDIVNVDVSCRVDGQTRVRSERVCLWPEGNTFSQSASQNNRVQSSTTPPVVNYSRQLITQLHLTRLARYKQMYPSIIRFREPPLKPIELGPPCPTRSRHHTRHSTISLLSRRL